MKKTVGEIVKAIVDHGNRIYLESAYSHILDIEMRKGGYSKEDSDYSTVRHEVAITVNAIRRRNRMEVTS